MVALPARTGVMDGSRAPDVAPCLPRQEYFPYGKSSDRRDERNRYRYIGVERDEMTGVLMTGPRTVDVVTGRFLQGEPLLVELGTSVYSYALSSPLRFSDASGRQPDAGPIVKTPSATPRGPAVPADLADSKSMAQGLLASNPEIASRLDAEKAFSAQVRLLPSDQHELAQALRVEATIEAKAMVDGMTDAEITAKTLKTETIPVAVPFEGTVLREVQTSKSRAEYLDGLTMAVQLGYMATLEGSGGHYSSASHSISVQALYESSPAVLVHEYVHAGTSDAFRALGDDALIEGATQYITEMVTGGLVMDSGGIPVPAQRSYLEETAAVAGLIESGAISEEQLLDAVFKGDVEAIQAVSAAWNSSSHTTGNLGTKD